MSLKRHDRYDGLLAVLCFSFSLAIYLRTLTPGLLHGDSGELQTLAYLLGHTHPTGYPIYLALAKMATFLPLGDVAYRVNLFSALMAALTVAGIYLAGRFLVSYRVLAFIGAMGLAISPTFWSQAVIAEVYTPGSLFLILILLALLWWDQINKPLALFLAGLLGGLSLGVHLSVALLAPAAFLFLLLHWRRGARVWGTALAGVMTGVIITVTVFWLMDLHNPTANYFNSVIEPSRTAWGLGANGIDGPLERLFFGWNARQFHTFMFSDIANVMPRQAVEYWHNLPLELGWPVVGLAGVGTILMFFRRLHVGALLTLGLAIQLISIFNYAIWDVYVFFIPSYVLLSLLSIKGMGAAVNLGVAVIRKPVLTITTRKAENLLEGIVTLLVVGFSFWPVLQPQCEALIKGDVPFENDEFPIYDDFALNVSRAMVTKLPENAIVFTDWDMMWPYYYAAHIIERRVDLTFHETYPADDIDGIAESVADYVRDNLDDHPIFFSERVPDLIDGGFKFIPARAGPVRLVRILDQ